MAVNGIDPIFRFLPWVGPPRSTPLGPTKRRLPQPDRRPRVDSSALLNRTLMNRVHRLVGDQFLTGAALRLVGAVAEEDVPAHRRRVRVQRPVQAIRPRVGMDAHRAEVRPQTLTEAMPNRLRQRSPTRPGVAHRRRRSRRQGGRDRDAVARARAPHHLPGDLLRLALVGLLRGGVRSTLRRRRREGARCEGRRAWRLRGREGRRVLRLVLGEERSH